MRILIIFLLLSACSVPPPQATPIEQPPVAAPAPPADDWEAATSKRPKPVAKKPAAIVVPAIELMPPCPPETGDKQKDLLRLLNCTMETADKTLPPPTPIIKK